MISILLASRRKNNPNSRLQGLINSLVVHSASLKNFEILIKFDDDDNSDISQYIMPEGFSIKTITTPRANGYADLHKSYLDLLMLASPESKLFWMSADDVEVPVVDWDEKLLEIADGRGKPFVINTVSHFNLGTMTRQNSLEKCDTCPVWSRKWLAVSGIGFSFATDGWTGMICHELERTFGIERERYRFFADIKPFRWPDNNPAPDSEVANGTRAKQRDDMIEKMLSPQIQSLVNIKAEALARMINE